MHSSLVEDPFSSGESSRKRRFSELEPSTPEPNRPRTPDTWEAPPLPQSKNAIPVNTLPEPPIPFDIDEFYRLFTRWYVKRNRPFTEMERETFRDILLYLEPSLDGQLDRLVAFQDHVKDVDQSGKQ